MVGKFPSASAHVGLVVQRQLHWSSVMPRRSAVSDQWGYPLRPFADDISLFFFFFSQFSEARAGCGEKGVSVSVSGPFQASGMETKEDSCRCLNGPAHMKWLTDTRTAVCWH